MAAGHRMLLVLPSATLLALFLVNAAWPAPVDSPKAKPSPRPTGQLNIEGQGIEQIILERRVEERGAPRFFDPNDTVVLQRPGPSVSVPVGEYWLQKVELLGGYSCILPRRIDDRTGQVVDGEPVSIRPGDSWLLRIGGPLKWGVSAVRQGRTLQVGCFLFDRNNRMCSRPSAQKPPRFTIYCDNRVVGSGSFEYG
jgi:hypothetical protein